MSEKFEEPKEDKSVCRRFVNWLNELTADLNKGKIAKTYRRELEEGDEIYRIKIYSTSQKFGHTFSFNVFSLFSTL